MRFLLLIAFFATGLTSLAQGDKPDTLPDVLIIGDSISMGYTKPVSRLLKGKAKVQRNAGNAAHSENGLAKLDAWLGDTEWEVIHFNHGLHDLKWVDKNRKNSNTRENASVQIPLEDYAKNLEAIVIKLKKTGATIIFATITPFPPGVKPLRLPEDAVAYNKAALEVMKKHDVAVNDLYAFTLPRLKELQIPKNVHFTKKGSEALAGEVAEQIEKVLAE